MSKETKDLTKEELGQISKDQFMQYAEKFSVHSKHVKCNQGILSAAVTQS